ncbi:hypothetical protein L218DRAFT_986430 [Marasmius fiardii PR-910]|nr:hypothetical protein L218DRAFT_986430 [Marasmius fiardii PR-910]
MYIPPSYIQNTTATTFDVDPNIGYQCNTRSSCFLIVTVVLMLIFYGLALWDRYIQLRLREIEKDQMRQTRMLSSSPGFLPNYGSINCSESSQYLTVPQNQRALYGERPPSSDGIKSESESDPPQIIQLLVPETR